MIVRPSYPCTRTTSDGCGTCTARNRTRRQHRWTKLPDLLASEPRCHRVYGPATRPGELVHRRSPLVDISILLIWLLLLASYQLARAPDGDGEVVIRSIRPTREEFALNRWWATVVCLATIVLWCVEREIEPAIEDMRIIPIIPIVAFFTTGVLKKVSREGGCLTEC